MRKITLHANVDPAPAPAAFVSGVVHEPDPAMRLGNPLRSLTPARAAAMMEASLRGEWTQIQWTMMHAERLDPDLMALVRLRTGGIGEYTWGVQPFDKTPQAKKQADFLSAVYDQIDNLAEVIHHLELAVFRGYAHVAVAQVGDGWELRPLDQWWWVRDGLYGDWYWNPEAIITSADYFRGHTEPINPADYLIREEPLPAIWLAVLKFLRSNTSQKWWDAFCETTSKQGTVITAPQTLSDSQVDKFKGDALAIARGGSGVLPHGANVVMTNTQRGEIPYDAHMRKLGTDLIRAVIGGTLAIDTQSGSGTLAGGAHSETVATIISGSARQISSIFRRQFDRRILAQAFPGQRPLAGFELGAREEDDVDGVIQHAATLSTAGYRMDPAQLSERTGYTITLAPPPEPGMGLSYGAGNALGNRALANRVPVSNAYASRVEDELGLTQDYFAPLNSWFAELEKALEIEDPAAAYAAAEELIARVPELAAVMDESGIAAALEAAMADAVVRGAAEGLATTQGGTK